MLDGNRLSDQATLAVLQTTQLDHERRITNLESNYGRLLFWTMGAALSSFASLVSFGVSIAIFLLSRHP